MYNTLDVHVQVQFLLVSDFDTLSNKVYWVDSDSKTVLSRSLDAGYPGKPTEVINRGKQ